MVCTLLRSLRSSEGISPIQGPTRLLCPQVLRCLFQTSHANHKLERLVGYLESLRHETTMPQKKTMMVDCMSWRHCLRHRWRHRRRVAPMMPMFCIGGLWWGKILAWRRYRSADNDNDELEICTSTFIANRHQQGLTANWFVCFLFCNFACCECDHYRTCS